MTERGEACKRWLLAVLLCSWRGHRWVPYQFLSQEGTPYCVRCHRWKPREGRLEAEMAQAKWERNELRAALRQLDAQFTLDSNISPHRKQPYQQAIRTALGEPDDP